MIFIQLVLYGGCRNVVIFNATDVSRPVLRGISSTTHAQHRREGC